ncbi:IPT/TIG domain-containing protein [Pontibacter sp. BAB1700]|uniref:IPT/TIG domain-containing protein n=1 Tax=Pontibacter sp. BAB1700 TaxID=1144253 RepID=UPI00026BDA76|nr:IPT/TIG domain-containing protein [Pontibacter sp. BAB1700]EJF08434.1 cell surface receptor IPT/TIG domain-containing protein [Pontibacter sp. BAB1700]
MVGQPVTLTGEHLQAELIEGIKLGNLECEILGTTGSSISVRVPENAATGAFRISTKGGEAVSGSAYTVWYAPGITGISKETDIVGASLTITGENFATDKARNKVLFGQALAQVLEANSQQLTVRVPEQAESGFIKVETPGGLAASTTHFEVIPGPKFTAMQPAKGSVGTVVEITGEHFGIMGQQDRITFNAQEALVLEASGDRYKVRVPRGASTGKVTITGYGGSANSSADFVVEELTPAEAIQVYPNPNSGQFTLSLRHADFDVQLVEVYDALGKRLHQTRVTGPRPEAVEINLPTAKAGLYFLQIQTERGLVTKKLTVL